MSPNDTPFNQAAISWDLETLYVDLASAKGKSLTPVEKLHLRGLLCGHSPAEIAQKLHKSVKGVESEVSTTLYIYVKNLLGKSNDKLSNWLDTPRTVLASGFLYQPVHLTLEVSP